MPSPLRICVVGDPDGAHTHRWVRWFVERGHEAHIVSFYPPRRPPPGVTVHPLMRSSASTPLTGGPGQAGWRPAARRLAEGAAPSLWRLVNGLRYQRQGLGKAIDSIEAD